MENFSILSKHILLGIFVCFSSIAFAQDFKVQHIEDDIGRSGGTNTSFTAVSSLNNAVALANNNRKSHAGSNGVTAAREGDDMAGGRALTGTGTLTYYRESGSQNENTRFNTTIWEYIGTGGGTNEFIVRGRYAIDLNGGTYTVDQPISGISNANKCIPFITGIMNDSGTDDADSGTAIAYLTSSSNMRVEKGGTNTPNVRVYITLVEFTGSNWTVLHGDSGAVAADTGTITLYDGSDGTGTATDVSTWSEAIIFSHHRGDTATSGTNDAHGDNWPSTKPGSDDRSIDWTFHSAHDSDGTNRHFVHVLTNSQISVTRYSDTSTGNATIDITSAGLTDLSQAMIVGSTFHSGSGAGYGRGWRNYKINSLTQAEHWTHRVGGGTATVGTELQIVNFVYTPTQTEGPGGVVTNLELWLKADAGVEEAAADSAEDTDPVLNWLDNTINNNDATQGTALNRPVFNENVLNFNPVIDFDGTNHEMTSTTNSNSTMTIFAVGEGTYVSDTKNIINLNSGGSGSVVIEQTAATTLQGRYYDGSSPSGIVTTTVANGTPFLAEYKHVAGGNSELFDMGISQGTTSANADNLASSITTYIGGHPSNTLKRWDGGIAEMIVFNQALTSGERDQVESYLAIKYGMTLGANGTSQDYVDSDGRVIWDQSVNIGYNNNVTGIGQDDTSQLNQKQSKTIHATNDITVGIKDIAANNGVNTNTFFADKTFLMWGHDNGGTGNAADITKDFSAATTVTSNASVTPITQKWKMVVTDSIPTIKLSIPESMVSGTNAGGEQYVMIVADDDAFTTNVTSATMEDVGSELEVDFYFEGTKYITFGSTPEIDMGDRSVFFDGSDSYLTAGDVNDLANMDFTISAWVRRDSLKMDVVSKRNYFHEAPGPPTQTYTHGYAFRINQTGQFRMVWRDPEDTDNNVMQTDATIPWNEWHHIAATYDASEGALGTTRLYIDGILEFTNDTSDPMNTPSDAHFMIGAAHHIKRQQRAKGNIDEVRVWNVALSANQIRYIMNQEITKNNISGTDYADGLVLPTITTKNEIVPIPWNNLIAYYPMSTQVFGSIKDESNSGNDASMINYDAIDLQTAPLPYKTTQNGDWDTSSTWENGDVQYLPGVDTYLDQLKTIDYNIVQIDHNVTVDNMDTFLIPSANDDNRTLLGLIINASGDLEVSGSTAGNTGNSITVSHYLKLDGTIDLEGESQLIQTDGSDLDPTSSGSLERDQQGNANAYLYNYWCSPVGETNGTTNNNAYSLSDVFSNIGYNTSGFNGTTSPLEIADYWVWKYANLTGDTYSLWQHVRSTADLQTGEGFTMKGVDVSALLADRQNYIFSGKPNNGDFSLTLSPGNEYLIGNPYPSAMDADEFIMDNISNLETNGRNTNGNVINGALYFWDHFANNSHYLSDYEGGYATYTLMGGAVAISNDARINASNAVGTKIPERYIPVGQGFFVSAIADASLVGDPNDPGMTQSIDGGQILFKNSQRVFSKENVSGSNTGSVFLKGNSKNKTSAKNANDDNRQKIRLMYDSPDGYHRQLLLGADVNATEGFDIGYDALIAEDNKEDMYWMFNEAKLIIQAVNHFDHGQTLPLGLKVDKEGLATIKIDSLENIDASLDIFIHDKELDIYQNLKEQHYEVFLQNGEFLDRFELTFQNNSSQVSLDIDDVEDQELQVYFSNEKESIIIHNPTQKSIEDIVLYNILGQSVYNSDSKTSENYIEHKTKQIRTGTYILKIKTEDGIGSKKVFIK